MFLHTETSKHQVKWGNQGHIVKLRALLPWQVHSCLNSGRCYGQNLDFSSTVGSMLPNKTSTSTPMILTCLLLCFLRILKRLPWKKKKKSSASCAYKTEVEGFFLGLKPKNISSFVQMQTSRERKNKTGPQQSFLCSENEMIRSSQKTSLVGRRAEGLWTYPTYQ